MKVKIEEELCGAQEEKERQEDRLLDKLRMQPRVVLRRLDLSEKELDPEWQEQKLSDVKDELEPPSGEKEELLQPPNVKKEEHLPPCIKEEDVSEMAVTNALLKTEEEGGLNEPKLLGVKEELEPPTDKKEKLHPTINKEEQLPPCIKEEGDFSEMPVTGDLLKTEGERGLDDEKMEAEPSSSSQQVTRDINGKHGEGSQADGWLAPISDDRDTTSHSSHTDVNNEEWGGEMTYDIDSKRWKCFKCGKSFESEFFLKRHMMCHTGEKPFACSLCDKRFSQNCHLKSHIRIHTGEKPFTCSVCGKKFSKKVHMREHTKTHTGEKPFACSVCGQRFPRKDGMREHTRNHTGEKPFACLVCGKKFSRKSNMKDHTKTHTGEKPFACSVCGRRFSRKALVIEHTRIHTGEKPFACSICGKRFSRKSSIREHTKTHTGKELFVQFAVKDFCAIAT